MHHKAAQALIYGLQPVLAGWGAAGALSTVSASYETSMFAS